MAIISKLSQHRVADKMKTVIIGGGIAGLSLAYHLLLRKGQHVVLVESATVGSKTTTKAAGMVTPSSEIHLGEEGLFACFCAATKYYPEFIDQVTFSQPHLCDFHFGGSILCAVDQDGVRELRRLHDFQLSMGLDVCEITPAAARVYGPTLSSHLVAATLAKNEGHLDPHRLVDVMKKRCVDMGLVLYENTTVVGLSHTGNRITSTFVCETRKRDLFATTGKNLVMGIDTLSITGDAFVVTSGLSHGVKQLDAMLHLPLRAVKGQVVSVQCEPGTLSVPLRIFHRYPIYLVPRQNGEIVIGATCEERSDENMTAGGLLDLIYGAWQILPAVYESIVTQSWAGLRPALPDHRPAIGPIGAENLHVIAGLYRHGIMVAPYLGRELAARLCGEASELNWSEFDPQRFLVEAHSHA